MAIKNTKVKKTKKIIIASNENLKHLIALEIFEHGNECNLNHIDVFCVTDMSYLFERSEFNGNISNWDVSRVKDMACMFKHSKFNGDISQWNVGKVTNMNYLFSDSGFNGDLNNWKPLNLKKNTGTFLNSKLLKNNNIPWWAKFTQEELKNEAIQIYLDKLDFKEKLSNELINNNVDNKKLKI